MSFTKTEILYNKFPLYARMIFYFLYKYFRNQRPHGRGSVSACAALKNRGGFTGNYDVNSSTE